MQKRNIAVLLLLVLATCGASASLGEGAGDVIVVGGAQYDGGTGVLALPDGGFLISGWAGKDALVWRIDAQGRGVWEIKFASEGSANALFSPRALPDGRVAALLVAGKNGRDVRSLVILHENGGVEAEHPLPDWAFAGIPTDDGMIVLSGNSMEERGLSPRAAFIALDGQTAWSAQYPLQLAHKPDWCYLSNGIAWNGGFLLTGVYSDLRPIGDYGEVAGKRGLLLFVSAAGEAEWALRTGGNDTILARLPLEDGRAFIAGRRYFGQDGSTMGFALMVNGSGEILWEKQIEHTEDQQSFYAAAAQDTFVIVSGNHAEGVGSLTLSWLDEQGAILDQWAVTPPLADFNPQGIVRDVQGNLWVYGAIPQKEGDIMLFRVDTPAVG